MNNKNSKINNILNKVDKCKSCKKFITIPNNGFCDKCNIVIKDKKKFN